MADDLVQILEHGRAELAAAEAVLAVHGPGLYGLCACLRPLPCGVREPWDAYATYWRARLELLGKRQAALSAPTMLLPTY